MQKFTKDLSYGSVGPDVWRLQTALERLGYGKFNKWVPFPFGPKTRDALVKFQYDRKIYPSAGFFGEVTRTAMSNALMELDRKLIYESALRFIGKDASPNDLAPDEYGCADSVCGVLFGSDVDPEIDWTISTAELERELYTSKGWMLIDMSQVQPGDVLVSATGTSSNPNTPIKNGHTGIAGPDRKIMSNNSYTGKFEQNYNFDQWMKRYVEEGGYKMKFFRKI